MLFLLRIELLFMKIDYFPDGVMYPSLIRVSGDVST